MKKYAFLDVSDGSTHNILQIVLSKALAKSEPNIAYGASVVASGKLSQTPKGQLELQVENFELIGRLRYSPIIPRFFRRLLFFILLGTCPSCSEGYPFADGQIHPPEYIRDFLPIRTHVGSVCSMLRVRHHATKAFHDYFDKIGFFQTQVPVLTSNDCEGAGEVCFFIDCLS